MNTQTSETLDITRKKATVDLDSLLNFRIQRLASKMTLITTREVLSGTGVNISEWRLICRLAQSGPLNLTALSRMIGLDPGSTSRLLKSAEEKNLVRRERDPNDGRAAIFHLTDFAARKFEAIWPQAAAVADGFHAQYSIEERELLNRLLDRAIGHANTVLE